MYMYLNDGHIFVLFVCLIELVLYVPINNFSVMSGWVLLG